MSDRAQPIRPLELPRLGSAGRKCTHSYAFVLDCSSNPEQIPTYARTSVQHSQRIGIKADLIGCARSLTVGAQGGRPWQAWGHRRLSRAEEKAYSLPAKLAIPMMVCIFPVLFVVILLPVVVRLYTGHY